MSALGGHWALGLTLVIPLALGCGNDADERRGTTSSTGFGGTGAGAGGAGQGGAGGTAGGGGSGGASPAGANLPIDYDLGSISGTTLFVATTGDDTGAGTEVDPLRTLAAALDWVNNGQSATVIVRGGEYGDDNVTIPVGRKIRILAYPGEIPTFRGSERLDGGWTTEGPLAWHAYAAQPVTDGSGISFTTGQNLTGDRVGKHPDQAWIGDTPLRQVTTKTAVEDDTFWVDQDNGRVYFTVGDAAAPAIEVSRADRFLELRGAGSALEGIRVVRYSNSADDYGVIRILDTAAGATVRNVEVTDTAFQAISFHGGNTIDTILQGALMEHVTIARSNWMGVASTLVDDLVLRRVRITQCNPFGEFTHSPQSGALKTSRNRHVRVIDSEIIDNDSPGLWFDQSNVDVDVAGNLIAGNDGAGVFFEISDDLLLINNIIRSVNDRSVKLAGSSGLRLINNTIVGGADALGIYTDNRSMPGCADPSEPLCPNSYSSDRDGVRSLPVTLDWMPRLDLMLNNIIAYPTQAGYCAGATAVCITGHNGSADRPLETIVHQADAARGIPQTFIDGNVYANGADDLICTGLGCYGALTSWTAAMAGAPVNLPGVDANGRSGDSWVEADGTPAALLNHAEAIPIPAEADINLYLPAGTRHYGALGQN